MSDEQNSPLKNNDLAPKGDEGSAVEALLAEAFAITRAEPSEVALNRMAAKAADIPMARPRGLRWLKRMWIPLGVGALAALALWMIPAADDRRAPELGPQASAIADSQVSETGAEPRAPAAVGVDRRVGSHAPKNAETASDVNVVTTANSPSETSPSEVEDGAAPQDSSEPAEVLALVDDDVALDFGLLDLPEDDDDAEALLDAYARELGDG